MEVLRRCLDCNLEANSTEDLLLFASGTKNKYGRRNLCKECKRNREYLRNYGITLLDYNLMYKEQKGVCAICSKPKSLLQVDHCHHSGKVRGLLCVQCNTSLGSFNDDIQMLEKAIQYLK